MYDVPVLRGVADERCHRRDPRRLGRGLTLAIAPAWGRTGSAAQRLWSAHDIPAAHWTHLRTTNVIESAFATIRHRSSRAKGCVTRQTMLSMIYKMGR